MRYIIDTNILINFKIFTPMKIHEIFWKQLGECIKKGEIVLIQDVANECKDRELKGWVFKQKIEKVSNDIKDRANEINKEYPIITVLDQQTKSEADPIIIAYAEQNNCCVFTREADEDPKNGIYKIPAICKKLNIDFQRWPNKVFDNLRFKRI